MMSGASSVIICLPDTRSEFGFGHLSRQCILVNYLCQHGYDAKLVLSKETSHDPRLSKWLDSRISSNRVLSSSQVHLLFDNANIKRRIVIDSYDYIHTATSVGCEPARDELIVFDDLAYERNYPANITPVVPNICSRSQEAKMAMSRSSGLPAYVHGARHLLLDPAFVLDQSERRAVLAERRHRFAACSNRNRELVLLMGFGGSATALPQREMRANLARFLDVLHLHCPKVEVRCLGNAAEAFCAEIGHPVRSLGWLNPTEMRQAYLDADVYLGAIGYAMWERAALLLPSFVVPIATNQIPYAETGEELQIHRVVTMTRLDNWMDDSVLMHESALRLQADGCGYISLFKSK
jgi:spore coat polysaccharide biosynthesis predicted glycosyltransferase SpsG